MQNHMKGGYLVLNRTNNSCLLTKLAATLAFGFSLLSWGDPYQILGVSPQAKEEEILRAYRAKAKENHPDVSSLPKEEAHRRFKQIQTAYEEIQKLRTRAPIKDARQEDFDQKKELEKEEARRVATEILESDLKSDSFGVDTLRKLPTMAAKRSRKSGFHFGRGPKEDGEWEALSRFLKTHQNAILEKNPAPEALKEILSELDIYTEFTGESVRDIRQGLFYPFEKYILEKTNDRNLFLEVLEDRLSRLSHAGAFPLYSAEPEERATVFGNAAELYHQKFGSFPNQNESSELQLVREVASLAFSKTLRNPSSLHDLEYLIRSVPSALTSGEKLIFFGDILARLETLPKDRISRGVLENLRERIESKIARVFATHPELKSKYAKRGNWLERLTGKAAKCDILLGNLARKAQR